MTVAISKSITLTEFLQLDFINESPAWEYIDGEVIQKSMGGVKHSTLQKRLVSVIDGAATQQNVDYEAFPELRCTPNGRSVVPDISVVQAAALPLDDTGEMSGQGIEFAPEWVIEVLSPGQSQTKVTDNILYCIRHGSRLGWLIDPVARAVLVFLPEQLPEVLGGEAMLPIVEGLQLELSVAQLFSWLKRG